MVPLAAGQPASYAAFSFIRKFNVFRLLVAASICKFI